MRGGEYLDATCLASLWRALEHALDDELAASGLTVQAFLLAQDSRWRLVGRVHFNLAENRKDSDRPFAFMATYASTLGAQGVASPSRTWPCVTRICRRRREGRAAQALGAGQSRKRKLRLAEGDRRGGRNLPPASLDAEGGDAAPRRRRDAGARGVVVRMPASWRMNRPSRPSVEATVGSKAPSLVGAASLLDFKVEVSLDGETLTAEEIERLVASTDGLAMLRGKWVEVDRERLKATLERLDAVERLAREEGVSFGQAMRLLAGAEIGGAVEAQAAEASWGRVKAGDWLAETLAACRRPETLAAAHPGEALKTSCVPIRMSACAGFVSSPSSASAPASPTTWGSARPSRCSPCCWGSAGEPGERRRVSSSRPRRFSPTGRRRRRVSPRRSAFSSPIRRLRRPIAWRRRAAERLREIDLVVTSYGSALRLDWIGKTRWRLVALDEAQAIKNPNAKQTRAVKALLADSRVALTGTPIENSLRDLWSIFDFLNPGLLGSSKAFADFVKRLAAKEPVSYAPLRKLVRTLHPAPAEDRSERHRRPARQDRGPGLLRSDQKAGGALSGGGGRIRRAPARRLRGHARRGLVLAYLMRLKQICNHPSQWLGGRRLGREGQRQVRAAGGNRRRRSPAVRRRCSSSPSSGRSSSRSASCSRPPSAAPD